jgi:chemotaxis protein methyltransferase CheR
MAEINTVIADNDFKKLSDFVYTNFGIQLPLAKKIMVQSRLRPRLVANNMSSFKDYCSKVLNEKTTSPEVIAMIDLLSTNKTDFYRESAHFDFMTKTALPEFIAQNNGDKLKVWSTASSSGEEIYTIAFVIEEFIAQTKKFNYEILGTDISTRILQKARMAIYDNERVDVVPMALKKKYLLRSKDPSKQLVRVIPQLRSHAKFARLNLMDDQYDVPDIYDIIFCRNVLIYFDRQTQEKVINKICRHLKKGGYLFLGHSESITGYNVPLKQLNPAIYQKL